MKRKMKKLLATGLAVMMMLGMTTGIQAEEKDKTVESTSEESTQEGTVWGSISDKELAQLKVTMPIKIEYAITPGAANAANKMVMGNYQIIVAKDSEVGVQVTKLNITQARDSVWSLDKEATVTGKTDNVHLVNIKIGSTFNEDGDVVTPGTDLAYGDNALTDFKVAINASKSLGLSGTGSKTPISASEAATKAFDVVYTIKQVPVTAAP